MLLVEVQINKAENPHSKISPHAASFLLGVTAATVETTNMLEVKWEVLWQRFSTVHQVKDTHKDAQCGFKNLSRAYSGDARRLAPQLIHVIHNDRIILNIVRALPHTVPAHLTAALKNQMSRQKRKEATLLLSISWNDSKFL